MCGAQILWSQDMVGGDGCVGHRFYRRMSGWMQYLIQWLLIIFRYYVAIVDEVLEDGSCSVVFEKYSTTEVTQVNSEG